MLTSLGVVVVGYLMGAYLQGERAGLLAAGLLAIFPLEIIFASQPLVFFTRAKKISDHPIVAHI